MTQETKSEFTVKVQSRGGSGRSARWQWEVFENGGLPLKKGMSEGAEAKAHQAGRDAITKIVELRAKSRASV